MEKKAQVIKSKGGKRMGLQMHNASLLCVWRSWAGKGKRMLWEEIVFYLQQHKNNKTHLERSSLARTVLPLRIQWWSGVLPLESEAFILAPYCRRSSNMPISAVWHARWSREQPSRKSSPSWSLLLLAEFKELASNDLPNESPGWVLDWWPRFGFSCNIITLARLKELLMDACLCTALGSASEVTIHRYTAFLSFLWTLVHILFATERRWCSFGLQTKSFSEYCKRRNLNLRHLDI